MVDLINQWPSVPTIHPPCWKLHDPGFNRFWGILGESLRISGWNLLSKNWMGLPYGENFIILTSTVFVWFTHLADGQTDGRYKARSAIYCRALKMHSLFSWHLTDACSLACMDSRRDTTLYYMLMEIARSAHHWENNPDWTSDFGVRVAWNCRPYKKTPEWCTL